MRHRLAVILPIYLILFSFSLFASYGLRFEFVFTPYVWNMFWVSLPLFLIVKLSVSTMTQEWMRTYRHATINDAIATAATCLVAGGIFWTTATVAPETRTIMPRSIVLLDGLLSLILVGGFRIACRLLWNRRMLMRQEQPVQAAFIYGNDETAVGIWKMLQTSNGHLGKYQIVGFIDPGPNCQRSLIGGQPVCSLEEFWNQARVQQIRHVLVPTTIPGRVLRDLLYQCQEAEINVHKIPTVEEIVDGRFRLAVRELDIDDLLRRPATQLDLAGIRHLVAGKTVLVTGGAGSIGSELCRQLIGFEPARLIVFDHSEFGVFEIERELVAQQLENTELTFLTGSILDPDALASVFETYSPALVFHAAAYKHVPLMEDNPYAAVRNNLMGTKAVVDAAHRYHCERFVLISTDKAVRPTSVMGATKLMAEKYLQAMAQTSQTKFITVRFGNVLNSVGSVVPTFRRQIEAGGPVTVTHPDMIRYFMTIPEAVQLVIQASAVGQSGSVLILDMGEPVKILDLAKDMITLSGLSYPDDIDIQFTGLRPGEKMFEELFYDHEQGAEKVHEKIFLGSGFAPTLMQINVDLQQLNLALRSDSGKIAGTLWQVVSRYVALDDQKSTGNRKIAAAA